MSLIERALSVDVPFLYTVSLALISEAESSKCSSCSDESPATVVRKFVVRVWTQVLLRFSGLARAMNGMQV